MSSLSIYAELLLNIRQVTIFVALPSNSNQTTKLELSSDGTLISINHDGRYAELELPCRLSESGYLKPPLNLANELSFRLPLVENHKTLSDSETAQGDDGPWPASSMTPETQIGCRSCSIPLCDGSIKVWKALPSENWAEMMDFWHCHKPDVGGAQHGDPHGVTKGYSASNRLGPTAGTGLVDITSFLLLRNDCINIKNSKGALQYLMCESCGEPLGADERESGGLRLYKWNIRLRHGKDMAWQALPVQRIISAKLLGLIESQATYKFLIYSGRIEEAKEALMLWVFTPDMLYSATARPRGPQRALKIFYKKVSEPAAVLEKQGMKLEELVLPDHVLHILHTELIASTEILPSSAKKLQDWEVGLLER